MHERQSVSSSSQHEQSREDRRITHQIVVFEIFFFFHLFLLLFHRCFSFLVFLLFCTGRRCLPFHLRFATDASVNMTVLTRASTQRCRIRKDLPLSLVTSIGPFSPPSPIFDRAIAPLVAAIGAMAEDGDALDGVHVHPILPVKSPI